MPTKPELCDGCRIVTYTIDDTNAEGHPDTYIIQTKKTDDDIKMIILNQQKKLSKVLESGNDWEDSFAKQIGIIMNPPKFQLKF
jgi:hypothetical protein